MKVSSHLQTDHARETHDHANQKLCVPQGIAKGIIAPEVAHRGNTLLAELVSMSL